MDSTVALSLFTLALLVGAVGCASDPPGESPSTAPPSTDTASAPSGTSAAPDLPAGLPTVRIGRVEFVTDYDAALAHARETDQLLWLHFGENPG